MSSLRSNVFVLQKTIGMNIVEIGVCDRKYTVRSWPLDNFPKKISILIIFIKLILVKFQFPKETHFGL